MNVAHISLDILIALFSFLLLRWMLKQKPQPARLGSQRMCPSCGLITSRLKASCMECGKPFTAVAYSVSKK
jgi:predicted amidophosphoribosyltransferase